MNTCIALILLSLINAASFRNLTGKPLSIAFFKEVDPFLKGLALIIAKPASVLMFILKIDLGENQIQTFLLSDYVFQLQIVCVHDVEMYIFFRFCILTLLCHIFHKTQSNIKIILFSLRRDGFNVVCNCFTMDIREQVKKFPGSQ